MKPKQQQQREASPGAQGEVEDGGDDSDKYKEVSAVPKLKAAFGDKRIIALAGDKSTGKTNNLMALLKDFREHDSTGKSTPVYVFGLNHTTIRWATTKFQNVYEVSSLEQLSSKKNALLIVDEHQLLNLNNRRHTELLNKFVDFVYHNNNWVILSSANLREFNSIIGSKVEGWLLKSLQLKNLVNGSQLKDIVLGYRGRYKSINDIVIQEKSSILIINDEYEKIIEVEYIPEIDEKTNNVDIFSFKKKEGN